MKSWALLICGIFKLVNSCSLSDGSLPCPVIVLNKNIFYNKIFSYRWGFSKYFENRVGL